mgnify:CR=1 FL=1
MLVPRQFLVSSFIVLSLAAACAQTTVWDNGTFGSPAGVEMTAKVVANDFVFTSTQTITAVRFWSFESTDVPAQTYYGSIYWAVYDHDPALNQPRNLIASGLTPQVTRSIPPQPPNLGFFAQNDFAIAPVTLAPGTYWIALHNGPLRNAARSDFYWVAGGVDRGPGYRSGVVVGDAVVWQPVATEQPDGGFVLFGLTPGNLIYSSYSPGNTFCDRPDCVSWAFGSGFAGPLEVGFRFVTPRSNSFTLDAVTLSLSAAVAAQAQSGPGGRIIISVNTDADGVPGAPLETLFYNTEEIRLGQPVTLTAASILHPKLEAGKQYWITAATEPAAGFLFLWHSNANGIVGPAATRSTGGKWVLNTTPGLPIGAFSVAGTPAVGVGMPPPPVAISDRVSVTQSDWTGSRDRSGQGWSTILTVTNTAVGKGRVDRTSPVYGPIQIVLANLSPNARVVKPSGVTREGWPYVTVSQDPLLPGASVSVAIDFVNSTGGPITFRAEAFSGVF